MNFVKDKELFFVFSQVAGRIRQLAALRRRFQVKISTGASRYDSLGQRRLDDLAQPK